MVPIWIDVKQHLWVELKGRPALVLNFPPCIALDGLIFDHDHPWYLDTVQSMRLKNGFGEQDGLPRLKF